ncbi:cytochrome b5-like heme/steroid binding domain-containing protein [Schizophyllum amplum]|uniref:Cytochrome b5-like heme/steroid binding domain-containing protein n=1 Tax=Schizophyllum amplum TaxID=97359 RepID=A0A550CTF0_9AGAR|nr:cytochrome b5-like heme/steroid binding domain-containing protein [Auriculariopsis ampla]
MLRTLTAPLALSVLRPSHLHRAGVYLSVAAAKRRIASSANPNSTHFSPDDPRNSPLLRDLITAAGVGIVAYTGYVLWPKDSHASLSRILGEPSQFLPIIQPEEVARHVTRDSCWVIFDGEVYDVTNFLDKHTAGANTLLKNAGKDVTPMFVHFHKPGTIDKLPAECHIGTLPVVSVSEQDHVHPDKEDVLRFFSAL